ncbi:hypothetical protein PIB30_043982 [Stylosanthes scabra]|uniref:Uncharacterized protein n=1 Tax=Stylosanthes scabra TaxID=79078 RepID=A0ABU6SGD5_9FABA|nr:hypothetical protein [Stylosanthes scabra]
MAVSNGARVRQTVSEFTVIDQPLPQGAATPSSLSLLSRSFTSGRSPSLLSLQRRPLLRLNRRQSVIFDVVQRFGREIPEVVSLDPPSAAVLSLPGFSFSG